MKATPRVTVILPAYRESVAYARSSIESLRAQTFRGFVCIIVLDDPKNRQLKTYFQSVCRKDTRFRLIVNTVNQGLAAALNTGIARARTEYIARHDADDICLPDRFKRQLAYLDAHREIDLLFGGIEYIDEAGTIRGKVLPPHERALKIEKHIFDDVLFIHPTLMAKTAVLQANPYNPSFRRSQDTELWLRLIGSVRFAILPEIVIRYRIPSCADARQRIEKVITWSRSAIHALSLHRKKFRSNPAYWRRLMVLKTWSLVGHLPSPLLRRALAVKDGLSRSKT